MSGLLPLSGWLSTAPDGIIAYAKDGPLSKSDLERRVAFWMQMIPAENGQRWAVYHQDSAEFLAILLALWQCGCTACIPGDNRPATRERLQQRVAGFVGDFIDDSGRDGDITDSASDSDIDAGSDSGVDWITPDHRFAALEIYTSGSTGEPKAIGKTFAQLDSELAALEMLWPGDHDAVIISTVTHQHFYGLIFRLLWPLVRGQSFETEQWQYTEDVYSRAQRYASFALVSTPSHLGRINTSVAWADVAGRCRSVLSSAAPLQRQDSLAVAQLLNAPVREIYGSSETGAIAWRVQTGQSDGAWQGLPGVLLSQTDNSLLIVAARQLAEASLEMSDRIEFVADGRFHLLERVDRIVKVEGKRVSLTEVERQVERSPWVDVAKALVISRQRTELALVVELTEAGRMALARSGKRLLVQQLRAPLQHCFEAVLLPRRWRFVEQLPYNPQGKLPMESLQALFDPAEVKWPELLSQTVENHSAVLVCHIPAALIYFDGHFAGNPILPGIAQIHWAEHYGRRLLHIDGRFERLEVVKFQQVIFPDSVISLALEHNTETGKLIFRFYSDKGVHSSGRICFS